MKRDNSAEPWMYGVLRSWPLARCAHCGNPIILLMDDNWAHLDHWIGEHPFNHVIVQDPPMLDAIDHGDVEGSLDTDGRSERFAAVRSAKTIYKQGGPHGYTD